MAAPPSTPKRIVARMVQLHMLLHRQIIREMCLPFDARTFPIDKVERGPSATIDGWDEIHIPTDLRFDSKSEIRKLFTGFHFPRACHQVADGHLLEKKYFYLVYIGSATLASTTDETSETILVLHMTLFAVIVFGCLWTT